MLVKLDAAFLDEVMWVWASSFPQPSPEDEVAHIYQFGLRNQQHWEIGPDPEPFPDAQPLCGAPAFGRGSHNPVVSGTGDTGPTQCTWCLVSLVVSYPHLFMKGGI